MDSRFAINGSGKPEAPDSDATQAIDASFAESVPGDGAAFIVGDPGLAVGDGPLSGVPESSPERRTAYLGARKTAETSISNAADTAATPAAASAELAPGNDSIAASVPLIGFDSFPAEGGAPALPAASPEIVGGGGLAAPASSGGGVAGQPQQAAAAAAVIDGTFLQLGPSPSIGPNDTVQSRDNPPLGSVAGAVQAIVTDPADVNTMWIGGPNGGIWVTHDGGAHWTPLTDKQASLSIASLSLDPTDSTHQTLIAGIGLVSNGTVGSQTTNDSFFLGNGGQRTGILYSTDGGATWAALGGATLAGHSIVGVAARGSVLLAAAFEPWAFNSGVTSEQDSGGLFRSTDGGATFTQVASVSGLPTDPVTSLVGDPASSSRLYAAITSRTDHSVTGVYVSNDTGATWSKVFGAAQSNGVISAGGDQMIARVATAAGGEIAVGLVDVSTGALAGLFLSQNSGNSWTQLATPSINPGGQGVINFAIALDPTNAGVVYVTGDRINPSPFTVTAFRVTTSGATSITDGNTGNNSSVHADSRAIAFDSSGKLILGTDGGIYARTNPTSSTGVWQGLNGSGLSLFQPYAVAFDGNSDRLVIAAQDTGVAYEASPGGQVFTAIDGGDGINATVNDVTAGNRSAIYESSQDLFLSRLIVDAQGNILDHGTVSFNIAISPAFSSPFVLNKIDPSRIAVGDASSLYITQDTTLNSPTPNVTLNLTNLGPIGQVTAIAYGTQDNASAIVAGAGFGVSNLWLSTATTPAAGTLHAVTAYSGLAPTSVTFDLRSEQRFYAVDGNDLFATQNGGTTMPTLTASLTALGVIRPTSVSFISNNGVNALLVGGLDNAANLQSPLAVADSDTSGNLSNFRLFGTGLPNTIVSTLSYDVKADTLAAGLFGRGGWVLYDVTSNFTTATVLQFGLANNDSTPDASLLTGSRPLVKSGTGTLTITGTGTYSGGSTINAGTMRLGDGGTLGNISGNVTDNATFVFDQPAAYTFSGVISGSGAVTQSGPGALTLSGANSYTGGSDIAGNATLILGSGAAAGSGTITFLAASGDLGLADDTGFGNTIAGLNVGTLGAKTNFVDIEGHTVTITGVTGQATTSGTITLSDGTVLHLANISSPLWFANTTDDGNGGTDVFVSDIACFCRGTRILTAQGEVAVEDLAIGDRVVTLSGETRPIKWIGRRAYDPRFVAGAGKILPIRIMAGALGDGLPARDLNVSPEHAMYLDGALIAAGLLVNGTTITQPVRAAPFEYFHVEFDAHEIILAEGAPTESYVECDNRGMFHNTAEFARLYPGEGGSPPRFCAPRLGEDTAELAAIRTRLAAWRIAAAAA